MAVIRKPSPPKTRKYQAIIRMNGYSLSRTFVLHEQAKIWARDCEAAIERSSPEKPFDRKVWLGLAPEKPVYDETTPNAGWTLDKALKHYAEHFSPDKKGSMQEKARIAQWQKRPLAKQKLGDVTKADLQAVIVARTAQGRSGSTVRSDIFVIRALYRDLVPGMANPCVGLELPTAAEHRERRLEDGHGDEKGEEERLRAALSRWKRKPDVHLDLFDFSIETGLRLSEAFELTVFNVTTVNGISRLVTPDSKNGKGRRVVLTARAKEIAQRRMKDRKPEQSLFPISDSARKRAWDFARKEAGVQDLRWHDLRHEGISRMAGKNLHMGELMAQSGHRDPGSVKRYMNARAQDIAGKLG